jgi:lipid II:glycine glycyltransferase (peptidoglycan interpeptide bridge formation enzyme)
MDKLQRGYDGPDLPVITALGQRFAVEKNLLIGTAKLENNKIAAILILCHGTSATYQIGWSSEDGRTHSAHHRLLFESLSQLRARGITDLDLGGINDDSAKGVKTFKTGMGGETIQLAGLYT